jgi:hypothetical protein
MPLIALDPQRSPACCAWNSLRPPEVCPDDGKSLSFQAIEPVYERFLASFSMNHHHPQLDLMYLPPFLPDTTTIENP